MIASLAIGYVLICLLAFVFQRRLIYFPTVISERVAEQVGTKEGFSAWRDNADHIVGWKTTTKSNSTATVLIVHGNAGSALNRGYIAQPIADAGSYNVHVLEYPGYGARLGTPSLASFLAAAEGVMAMLDRNRPIYVVSESIGTGVAAHLAKKFPDEVSGLLMFAPYDNLASVAQSQMPMLPAYFLLKDRFKPAEWLNAYRGPIKIVVAENDEIIPVKFGRKLFDDYAGPKELLTVPGAGHNDVAAQSADWWKSVFSFWEKHSNPPPQK